ncbi:U-box domain-containing protein 28-like [Primulina huaijiensis]|uniref:U-box domain-containing protein 28-like n=1 Tax=Primulina huaijiensis TaxID=1492673 RepID=UPI003CC76DC7
MAREKRSQELNIAVPSLFRCPISMDVMKSPVSLCTGVTYDRTSIETWLALGHNTCPATMQTLPSTHTTPNLTLRRLINLWISQAQVLEAPPSSPTSAIPKQQVAELIEGELNPVSLDKIIGFIKASEENLKFVAQSCDTISRLVEVFGKADEIRVSELIVEIFYLMARDNVVGERLNELILKSTTDCLSSFAFVLQKGSSRSKVKCAEVLEIMALNPKSQLTIAGKPDLLRELCNLLTVTSAAEASFSALSVTMSNSRQVKKELIRFGLVARIGEILSSSAARAVNNKALGMLAMIATCTEGRAVIAADEKCVVGIVEKLIKCSGEATENGIRVLWSVCCLGRDTLAQGRVVKVNGLTKVLLVMQSDCSECTRQMCGELVKVLRAKNVKSNLGPYQTGTTHITPY